jgi:hypothetical protein
MNPARQLTMSTEFSIDEFLQLPAVAHSRAKGTEREPAWNDGLVYHYTSFAGLMSILYTQRLKLGTYGSTNDPRENKKWVAEASSQMADMHGAAHAELDRLIQGSVRLACFTAEDRSSSVEVKNLLHRGWARPAMWGRYAEEHSGACLVFDRSKLNEHLGRFVEPWIGANHGWLATQEVRYSDTRRKMQPGLAKLTSIAAVHDALVGFFEDRDSGYFNFLDLYFRKTLDWSSEREERFSAALWNLPSERLSEPLFSPYGDALVAVILGESNRSGQQIREAVNRQIANRAPVLLRCRWEAGEPSLISV